MTRVVAFVPTSTPLLVQIRIQHPLENWASRYDGSLRIRDIAAIQPCDLYWGDIFIIQRLSSFNILKLISELKKYGKKVVFEIDDLLTDPPPFLHHQSMKELELRNLKEAISSSDVVSTTTSRLRKELLWLNSEILITPNCISVDYQARPERSHYEKISLVISSSDLFSADFLLAALRKAKERYADRVEIHAIGAAANFFQPDASLFLYPIQSYSNFKKLLSDLINPIGIIPLDASIFSSCKSPIKFFDYANLGIPTLCSNVPPYSDFISNEDTGILVSNNEDAWFKAIGRMIDDQVFANSVSERAQKYVQQHYSMDEAGDAWQKTINSLKFERVESPELLNFTPFRPPFIARLIFLGKRLLTPQFYVWLRNLYASEGWRGVWFRLINFFKI